MERAIDLDGLVTLLCGQMAGQVITTAIELDLVELIGDRAMTSAELAKSSATDERTLERLLRALAAIGVLQQAESGAYRLTDVGRYLRADVPDSMLEYIQLLTESPVLTPAWRQLGRAVRIGESVFPEIHGASFYDYLAKHPQMSEWFNTAIRQGTRMVAEAVADAHDFAGCRTVLDVGGGDGTLLSRVLATHQHLDGVLFDSEPGLAESDGVLSAAGVAERCSVRTGDFFAEIPGGADRYLLKSVLHDWDDERAALILVNCRRAIPEHGRLVIIEPVLPGRVDGSIDPRMYLSDLNLLVNLGGQERDLGDFERLCTGAGFAVEDVRPARPSSGTTLITASPNGLAASG